MNFYLKFVYTHLLKSLPKRRINLRVFFPLQATVLLTSLLVLALLGVRHLGGLQFLETAAFDAMLRLRPANKPDPRLLIVEITESDIQTWQQSTLSDRLVAKLLEQLQQHQPSVIGLDLYRDIPQPPGNAELLNQLQADNVIAITKLGIGDSNSVPPPAIPLERVGFNDFLIDADGRIRRNLMYGELGEQKLTSFSLQVSLSYLAKQNLDLRVEPDFLQIGSTDFDALDANSGGYQMSPSDAQGWQVLLNYRTNVARQVTLTQVLENQLDPSWVKDKIVLIGYTAPSKKDLFSTPYGVSRMPGVLVHAQMTSQILGAVLDNQPLFWFWSQWGEVLWIWGWAFGGAILAWRLKRPLWLGVAILGALGGLSGVCMSVFLMAGWIPLIPPAFALISTAGAVLSYRIFYSSLHDELTGLPNRLKLLKQLQHLTKQDAIIAVLFVDLDRFKTINESLGHPVGDRLLVLAQKRMRACLRSQDKLARVGGDEFAIVLQINGAGKATTVAGRLQETLALPFILNGQEICITASLGITFFEGGQETKPEELLRDAHTAMNRAKASGKNGTEIFTQGMHAQAVLRLQLENDLRQAINRREFQLYYQPIIDLKTGKIAGFEALVRWVSPQRGFVSPGEFIPLAEETGLIIPLGAWILQAACRQLHGWHQQFPQHSSLTMSVNLSSCQLTQPDLVEQIEQILQQTEVNTHCLKLEITESAVMESVEAAIALFERLKALGIKLSIDDFGTGYSSLSYLHHFRADTLKVDRSFVKQLDMDDKNANIVSTIVMLAHKLGMDVVAEGIETSAQQAALQAMKCEYGQGYLFAKPLDSEAATEWLNRNT